MTMPLIVGQTGLPRLPMADFARSFAEVLPGLIRFMVSDDLRYHPKWGSLMPFAAEAYGQAYSLGHVCRPDVIMTNEGPRVTEIDFVPSGRGWLLASLSTEAEGLEYLETYYNWYCSMGYPDGPVYYATGTTTVCKEETDLFSYAMQCAGYDMRSVNIDAEPLHQPGLIDRLFYRAELAQPFDIGQHQIITAEPWLDSKMIFAVVHDPQMTDSLTQYVGTDGLAFLRTVLIPTYLLEDLVHDDRRMPRTHPGLRLGRDFIDKRDHWVIKSTEVEEAWSWGARSVVIGSRTSRNVWEGALRFAHGSPSRKELGEHPIVQQFCPSVDFSEIWNGVVDGNVHAPDPARFGKPVDPVTSQHAKREVVARVGIYFLVNNVAAQARTLGKGILTLRQDPLAHGASDALITGCDIV